ncbi:MAG: SpoVA/SpoVAEb family sporulation membrane protein [Bacillota bacterium]|nr:SpoVA/SpoVAEb family sporulation membrane protein [Bacillota bacterium]
MARGVPGVGRSPGKRSEQVERYKQLAQEVGPKRPLARNVLAAFVVGGAICALGQGVLNYLLARGLPKEEGIGLASAALVVIAALLTGIGVYDVVGEFGGMGSAIPITGFANSIVSPALEFKREGYVLGVGARLFTVAGPVIVWGLVVSILVGAVRLLLGAP